MPRRMWRSVRREWDQLPMQIGASTRRVAAARAAGRRASLENQVLQAVQLEKLPSAP
jgi:hypothetical protein